MASAVVTIVEESGNGLDQSGVPNLRHHAQARLRFVEKVSGARLGEVSATWLEAAPLEIEWRTASATVRARGN